ncbi:MAG: bacteriohemerythrin [Gammaproteobacteria bacterium]|jgi:hemerythrin
MAFIVWDEQHSVRVRQIDDEHKGMITLVNELNEAMKQRKGREEIARILSKLIAYTRAHFAAEERLMMDHDYAGYPRHKAEHERLLQEILVLEKRFSEGDLLLSFGIMLYLKGWAMIHISSCDKALGAYLNDKSVY